MATDTGVRKPCQSGGGNCAQKHGTKAARKGGCCCGDPGCSGTSQCCPLGLLSCLPTKDAYFPDNPNANSGIFLHGPVGYSFKGTIQTSYPSPITQQLTPTYHRRLYSQLTVQLDLSGTGLLIPRDALAYAPSLKQSNQTLPGYPCVGGSTLNPPATYPLFGADCILRDVELATYTTGNAGTNGQPAFSVAGSFRAQVCATYIHGDLGDWPQASPVNKVRFVKYQNCGLGTGYLLGANENVFKPPFGGIWFVTLVLYHVRQPFLDGNQTIVKGVIQDAMEPLISVGARTLQAQAIGMVACGGSQRIFSVSGGPEEIDFDGFMDRSFTRAPTGGVVGFKNSCGCVVRTCGFIDAASKYIALGGTPASNSTNDAHQDYHIDYDVTWGGINKCNGSPNDSSTSGSCGAIPPGAGSGAFL